MSHLSATKLTLGVKWDDMDDEERLAEQVATYGIVSKCGGEIKAQYVLWSDNCLFAITDYPDEVSAMKSQQAIARRGRVRAPVAASRAARGRSLVARRGQDHRRGAKRDSRSEGPRSRLCWGGGLRRSRRHPRADAPLRPARCLPEHSRREPRRARCGATPGSGAAAPGCAGRQATPRRARPAALDVWRTGRPARQRAHRRVGR